MSTYVLRFDEAGSAIHALVGGKGANLGRLTAASFPVPPGFTVTTSAYDVFLATDDLGRRIQALLVGVENAGPDELEQITASIRALIQECPLPDAIAEEIRNAYETLGDRPYVAVRSSGTAEDLDGASFAGMHDTYLDIVGTDAVLDAVKRCWASLWTARATSYRTTKGFDHSNGIAVVVQRMIPSEVSGVMFTANPLTTATDEIVINASWGLGEAIVSGITTPDEYIAHHHELRVLERTLGSKERRVVRDPRSGMGTIAEDTPLSDRGSYTLTDAQVATLADLGRRVQAHYGGQPQDTEWGYAEGEFFLLQSRPVTGVDLTWDDELEYWQERPEVHETVWTRAWTDAIWNGGCTPLMYSLRANVYTTGQTGAAMAWGLEDLQNLRVFKYYKGTAYYNCSLEREMLVQTAFPIMRPGMTDMIPPSWRDEVNSAPFSISGYLKLQARCHFLHPSSGALTWRKKADKYLVDGVRKANGLSDERLSQLSDEDLERYLLDMNRFDSEFMEDVWTAFLVQARDAMGLLGIILAKWYDGGNPMVFADLITGVPRPTATQIENAALWNLARTIQKSPTLRQLFNDHEGADFLESAHESEEGRQWLESYEAFLSEHGHRGHSNRDIFHPRRSEDPGLDYRSIGAFLAAETTEDPSAKEHLVEARRQEVIAEVVANLRKKSFGGLRAEVFKATLEYVMMFLLFRDDERHWLDRVTFSIKRGFTEVGRRLVGRGLLVGDDDFYYLSDRALFELLHGTAIDALVQTKVVARRHHFERLESGTSSNPMYVRRNRNVDLDFDRPGGEALPDGVLRGSGTSGGVVEGTARVIHELKDIGRVREGDILIVNATDPGWTPVFLVIKAIVLETGGLLAHGSCLAREYGMPAVHLPGAMKLVPDGAVVRINGNAGTVEIVGSSVAAMTEA